MSGATSPDKPSDTPSSLQVTGRLEELGIAASLEELQTDEQRRVLDKVAQARKCGLDSILSLPQLVVCGDQSAGKSSVLEALTEIPFPRNDNLCTRYATEIDLRRGSVNTLKIKLIPDDTRPPAEREVIRAFEEVITDFSQLPKVMDLAMTAMGITITESMDSKAPAFAKDILSIEIEGPSRPQLTLVDIPGLIQASTKGVSNADVNLATEITDNFIRSPRTICLAIVSATNDAANQPILRKVREVDPTGDCTLGIITKPDRLPAGSGSEKKFLELAQNGDVFFKLKARFFRMSNFKSLPKDNVGIDSLRARLSLLLFEHVKQELPKLRKDLEDALQEARGELELLGSRRSNATECKAYLAELSLNYYEVCKAAVNGHYEGQYFHRYADDPFSLQSRPTLARLRAVIQHMNTGFYSSIRKNGHKYQINMWDDTSTPVDPNNKLNGCSSTSGIAAQQPAHLSKPQALQWVRRVLLRTRGKELVGNFNPLVIGELFWEQSCNWHRFAEHHIDNIAKVCKDFLQNLLDEKCPKDVKSRLWSHRILDALKYRHNAAFRELNLIIEDVESFPINYNHYYTDTIHKRRLERYKASLEECLDAGTQHTRLPGCQSDHTSASVNVEQVIASFSTSINPNMEDISCEEVLDCLLAIYKVLQKNFIANITTQVIERHMVRGLESIFSPVVVNTMFDAEVEAIASEPMTSKRQREFLEDRIKKLDEGHGIFRAVMGRT